MLELPYAAMALGMAAMFSPVGDPVPGPAWAVLFALSGAWFGAVLLRFRSPGVLDGEALHVVVGSAAMLFMLGADHGGRGRGRTVGTRRTVAERPGMVGVASAVALVFAAYFVLHTLRCADRLRTARAGGPAPLSAPVSAPVTIRPGAGAVATAAAAEAPPRGVCSGTVAALAHLLMTAAMAYMSIVMI